MRMLMTFLEKLTEKLSRKSISEISDSEMNDFYVEFFDSNRQQIITLNAQSLLEKCTAADTNKISTEKIRILAELLYIEANKNDDAIIAKNSLFLFDYYNSQTKIFDFDISDKMNKLLKIIH